MDVRVFRSDHPEVVEVVASDHCVQRFRRRLRIRSPGIDPVAERLAAALQDADFTRWPPGWVSTDRETELWALVEDIAFPLTRAPQSGRWIATTCLVRPARR